ncbi:MAG: hypothetical protein M0T71_08915 [Actinomycetota bacterium]|nr:hypothetical protein [Actinomycetota bacterium]
MDGERGARRLERTGPARPDPERGVAATGRRPLVERLAAATVGETPLVSCLSWTLAGAVLINWSIQLLGAVTVYPWVAALVVIAGAWGLVTVIVPWLRLGNRIGLLPWRMVASWGTVGMVLACYLAWAFLQIHASPGYGTDEIAFDQYAAVLASHGVNPYLHSMLPAFAKYNVSPDGFTYRVNGSPVTALSYPSLAFLLYVPFLLLGWSTQLAVMMNALAWAVAIVAVFLVLPRPYRPLALVLGSLAAYDGYALGGVTDMLYLPLLIGAAYRWTDFVHGSGWRRYVGPVSLGLAMAVKQTPWLVAPFLLVGVVLEARPRGWGRSLRGAMRYVAAAGLTFLVPNLYYLALSPRAWLHGVLTPLSGGIVPAGQGVIGFSLYLRLGGGSLAAYSLLAVAVLLGLLAAYALTYPVARPVTFVLASPVLFFASRSFGSYLVALLPVLVVSATSTELAHGNGDRPGAWSGRQLGRRSSRAIGLAASVAIPAGALLYAVSVNTSLAIRVTGLRSTGQLATVEQLTLQATNRSGHEVYPHFSVDQGGAITTFWQVAAGPRALGPGRTARYTLRAPNFPAQPSIAGGFQVMAFTTRPGSVAETVPYIPDVEHVTLTPEAVNQPIPIGATVKIQARLVNQLDQPVYEAGVPVYLGQVIYDQLGLIYSEAVINGRPPGQTPVTAYTNANGVATFDVIGTQATTDPVYFEANLVNGTQFFPYGYSSILAVRFSRS